MKWFLGVVCGLLLFNFFAQQQTINDLRSELRKANAAATASIPAPTATVTPTGSASPTSTATPTSSTTTTPSAPAQTTRPIPPIDWTGDTATCNKWDKQNDWWTFTHAYLSDPVKHADYKIWFLYSQNYVDTFAFCFDRAFVNKVNEIASTIS